MARTSCEEERLSGGDSVPSSVRSLAPCFDQAGELAQLTDSIDAALDGLSRNCSGHSGMSRCRSCSSELDAASRSSLSEETWRPQEVRELLSVVVGLCEGAVGDNAKATAAGSTASVRDVDEHNTGPEGAEATGVESVAADTAAVVHASGWQRVIAGLCAAAGVEGERSAATAAAAALELFGLRAELDGLRARQERREAAVHRERLLEVRLVGVLHQRRRRGWPEAAAVVQQGARGFSRVGFGGDVATWKGWRVMRPYVAPTSSLRSLMR